MQTLNPNSVSNSRSEVLSARTRTLIDRLLSMPIENPKEYFSKITTYLNHCSKLNSNCLDNYILAAKAYIKLGNAVVAMKNDYYMRAIDVLNAGIKLDVSNTTIKYLLAKIYIDIGNYEVAEKYINEVLTLRNTAQFLEVKGDCAYKRKDYKSALISYASALQLQPRSHYLHFKKASCLMISSDDVAGAYLECKKALYLKQNFTSALKLLKHIVAKSKKVLNKSKKATIAYLDSLFDEEDVKNKLFSSNFDTDSLTGLANDHALNAFVDQSTIESDLTVITIIVNDLRLINLVHGVDKTNDELKSLALKLIKLRDDVLIISRPNCDRIVVIVMNSVAYKIVDAINEIISSIDLELSIGVHTCN